MDREAELTLVRRAQDGDRAAMGELVEAFTGLLKMVAKRHGWKVGLGFDDAYQEARILFLDVVRTFDVEGGFRFSPHAGYKVPLLLLNRKRDALIPVGRGAARKHRDADSPSGRKFRGAMKIAPLDAGFQVAAKQHREHPDAWAIGGALASLTRKQRTVIIQYYGLDGEPPREQGEIGRSLGVDKSRVSQVHIEALGLLRDAIRTRVEAHAKGRGCRSADLGARA